MNGSLIAATKTCSDSKAALQTNLPILPNPLIPILAYSPFIFGAYGVLVVRSAIPGIGFPSRSSKAAPPPVLI